MTPEHEKLLRELEQFSKNASTANSLMERIAHRVHETMTRYNWVGFYVVDPTDPGILVVGAYAGSFAPNTRIPLNTGLCGAAASSGKTVIVDDVTKDPRYLPGSTMVNSEMVVPIFAHDRLAGEFDVESYFTGTFTHPEQEFVEACAALVGKYLEKAIAG